MNRDMTSGPPEGQEPIEQLFRDLFELADQTAQRITDDEVGARLDQLLRKTGHTATPPSEPFPASVLDAARRQAGEIVADAQRAAVETAAEAACAAQSAEEAARLQAERVIAEADKYADTALCRAAAIIAEARSQAESIITEARKQAGQIVADAHLQAASRERQLALTSRTHPSHDGWMPTTIYYNSAGSEPAESHYRLSGFHVLRVSLPAPQYRANRGLVHRSLSSVVSWWQQRSTTETGGCLVVAHADGIVTSAHIVLSPDDDAHVADLRTLLSGLRQLEAIHAQQASQDGG